VVGRVIVETKSKRVVSSRGDGPIVRVLGFLIVRFVVVAGVGDLTPFQGVVVVVILVVVVVVVVAVVIFAGRM
jgi:hypothetical protein